MKTLTIAAVASVALLAASTAHAQTLRYEEDSEATYRYSRLQKDHVVQTVNGQEQVSDIESYWRFATTIESTGDDAVTVSVVHDSVSVQSPALPQTPDFSGLYGVPIQIRMSDRGEVSEVVVPDTLPEAVARLDLRSTYGSFYPVLPEGEAEAGTTWSDTTEVQTNQNGLDVTVQRVNDYTVAGTETADGREAVRIDFVSTFELEGTGNQQGAQISLSGTGEGTGHYLVEPDQGVYLGGGEDTEMTMDAFVSAGEQNLMIPIIQTRTERVELVE